MLKLLLITLLSITKLTKGETETLFQKRDIFSPFDPKDTPSTFTEEELKDAKQFNPSLPDVLSNSLGGPVLAVTPAYPNVRPSTPFPSVKPSPTERPFSALTQRTLSTVTSFSFSSFKPTSDETNRPFHSFRKPIPTPKPPIRIAGDPKQTQSPSFSVFGLKIPSSTGRDSFMQPKPFNFVVVTPKPLDIFRDQIPHQSDGFRDQIPHQTQGFREHIPHQPDGFRDQIPHQTQGFREQIPHQTQGFREQIPQFGKETFDYDYSKAVSNDLEVSDNFFGESETTNIFDQSKEFEPIRGNVYYYFYPVKRISNKRKSPFSFFGGGSNDDHSVQNYHHDNNLASKDEGYQGAFGLFKLVLPLLLLGAFLFALSQTTVQLSMGPHARSLDKSVNNSVIDIEEDLEKLFKNYVLILESDQCLERLICEIGVKSKEYSISLVIIRLFESYVPKDMSKLLKKIFKSANLDSKNQDLCKKFSCSLQSTLQKFYSVNKTFRKPKTV